MFKRKNLKDRMYSYGEDCSHKITSDPSDLESERTKKRLNLLYMYTHCWQIIRDDSKKTFEVCGQDSNTNHFCNATHGMQKAGMNVSYLTPPVTGKSSSKDAIKIAGYVREVGLHERLLKEYREITRREFDQWEM